MPRTARASVGGIWYHALNRGNRRDTVFHKPGDFDAFVDAMAEARVRRPVDILGYCLMPNHFHILSRPAADGDLGRYMQWLLKPTLSDIIAIITRADMYGRDASTHSQFRTTII